MEIAGINSRNLLIMNIVLGEVALHGASSTYSAFHSRSPTRAVTEIHTFSMWN
jgi:hypothetical protein